jgi:hypothetical protein
VLLVAREQGGDGPDQSLLGIRQLDIAHLAGLHARQLRHELAQRLRGLVADHAALGDERAGLAVSVVEAEHAVRVRVLGPEVPVQARVEGAAQDVVHHPHRKRSCAL